MFDLPEAFDVLRDAGLQIHLLRCEGSHEGRRLTLLIQRAKHH